MWCPAFPFIGQGKARVITEEKEKNQREKKASRITRSFFLFMQVPSVMAFHSVPVDVVVN